MDAVFLAFGQLHILQNPVVLQQELRPHICRGRFSVRHWMGRIITVTARRIGQRIGQRLLFGDAGGEGIELDDMAVIGIDDAIAVGRRQVRAHGVIRRPVGCLRTLQQVRQQVAPPMAQSGEPVVVVGADPAALQFVCRHVEQLRRCRNAALHAVTDADGGDGRVLMQRPHDRRHGVGMVEQNRLRTALLHPFTDAHVRRNRAESHHHTRRTRRITDDLVNAVLRRDVHVGVVIPGSVHIARDFGATATDGTHGEPRAIECVIEIRGRAHAQARAGLLCQAPSCGGHTVRLLPVDVVEHDFRAGQVGCQSQVGEHAGEIQAASTEACDLRVCHWSSNW